MAPLDRWNDDRLDDLNKRVDSLTPLPAHVATLTEQIVGLRADFKEMRGDPIADARARRNGLLNALLAAVIGGAATVVATLIATNGHL